jgi:hypothetical protein
MKESDSNQLAAEPCEEDLRMEEAVVWAFVTGLVLGALVTLVLVALLRRNERGSE